MGYRVFWHVPQQVIYMEIAGDLNLNDFHQINRAVTDLLDDVRSSQNVALLVDITQPGTTPQLFAQLKESQTYLLRRDLKFIVVAGSNKLMRLMMLLTFNLRKPSLRFFDSIDQALKFLHEVVHLNKEAQRDTQ
jgi:hypothetical protein